MTYFLFMRIGGLTALVPLNVLTFNSAKAIGGAWKLALSGCKEVTLKIRNEKGLDLWTL